MAKKNFYRAEKVEALRELKKFYADNRDGDSGDTQHIPQVCAIDGCTLEASKWIDTNGMKMKGAKKDGTLYLCSACACQLYGEDGDGGGITLINPKTMEILTFEVAEYSCDDSCEECNQ